MPGQAKTVSLVKGKASGVTVAVEKVHGASNLWVEDRGSEAKPGSYAAGLSPTLHVENPTLRQVSETENIAGSALRGDFVRVNVSGRRLIATGIAVDGFYLTDLDEPTDAFNAIFVHTHSRPEGVTQGDQIIDILNMREGSMILGLIDGWLRSKVPYRGTKTAPARGK